MALVFAKLNRNIGATGAVQAGNAFLAATNIYPKVVGDLLSNIKTGWGAVTGADFSCHRLFSESPTAGFTAGTAVIAGQQVRDRVYPGIFKYFQALVSERKHDRQDSGERRHKANCLERFVHAVLRVVLLVEWLRTCYPFIQIVFVRVLGLTGMDYCNRALFCRQDKFLEASGIGILDVSLLFTVVGENMG